MNKNEQSPRKVREAINYTNICLMAVSERGEKEGNGEEFQKRMTDIFPNF